MSSVVGILYDKMTDDVELQVLRDLMLLKGEWPDLAVSDPAGKMDEHMLAQVGVALTQDPPELIVNYKVGTEFMHVDSNMDVVERDLSPPNGAPTLDGAEHQSFYLRPQGRDGANLTEMYLNRSHPRGNGVTDPLVILLWS